MGADQDAASSGAVEVKGEEERPLLKNGVGNDDTLVAVPSASFGYNAENRPYRDIAYSIAFVIFVTASLGVGIFAIVNRNPDYQLVGSATYEGSEGCTLPEGFQNANSKSVSNWASSGIFNPRNLLSLDAESDSVGASVKAALFVLIATLVLSAPLAYGLLWILRTYTKEFVYVTLPFFVIIPVGCGISLFVSCSLSETCSKSYDPILRYCCLGFVLCLNVFFLWVLYRNWDRVELTIRIIRTASEALHKNLGLLLLLPALNVGYLFFLIPAAHFLYFAYTNGKIVINPELVQDPELVCGGTSERPCCVWETDLWVPAYITIAGFVVLWGAMIVTEIHVFTISGTISQWYFATSQSSTVGTTRRSLLHAVGPSFGTVCFSGLVVAFIKAIRAAIDSSRSSRGEVGFVALIIRACLVCLLSAVEFMTKFTTNFAAITGQGFCASAVLTFDLLRRNLLSTLVVESVTGRLLGQAIFVVAAVYGLLVWGVLALVVHDGKYLWVVAFFGFLVLLLFLAYCVQILDNVVDTVYICYAMDKDHNEVSKREVHDVYVLLPAVDDGSASLAVSGSGRR